MRTLIDMKIQRELEKLEKEKTKFGMELGSRKSSPMLEISYNTVKKDGSFGAMKTSMKIWKIAGT